MAEFLSRLTRGGDELYARVKVLNRADESRPKGVLKVCVCVCACVCDYVCVCVHVCV